MVHEAIQIPGCQSAFSVIAGTAMADGPVYRKEILYEGTFIHPSTNKKHVFDRASLEAIADNSNALTRDAGISIPFPDGHRFDTKDNLGFWSNFYVAPSESSPGVDGLYGEVRVPVAEHSARMGKTITEVSAFIEPSVKLTTGEKHPGPVMTHVCATNYPVIPSQTNFVARFDKGEKTEEIKFSLLTRATKEKGDHMDLLQIIAVSLGLSKDAPEVEVIGKAKEFFSKAEAIRRENDDLRADLSRFTSGGKPDESPETEREKALARENLQLRQEKGLSLLKTSLSDGRITKAEFGIFSKLISVGKTTVVPLGETDAVEIDCFSVISDLIESRDKGSAFNQEPLSGRGDQTADGVLAQKKKDAASNASYFAKKGYEILWNEDRSGFNLGARNA